MPGGCVGTAGSLPHRIVALRGRRFALKPIDAQSVVAGVRVREITMKPLLLIGVLVSIAAPAFAVGLGLWTESAASPASMVWLGLFGLALAGSRRRRGDTSEPSADA
jgi:MYXO-CTERM domain-containing protein